MYLVSIIFHTHRVLVCTSVAGQGRCVESLPSIQEVSSLLEKEELSSPELYEICSERLELTSQLNAFITVTSDDAADRAAASEDRRKSGARRLSPLDGIPVAVKDNFCMEGVTTTCGSRMLANYYPPYDATMVAKLKASGAVIMGKTNMDEFAMGCGSVDGVFGPVRNPWKYDFQRGSSGGEGYQDWHIAGGSSGGSAVAVACGAALAALGSDTGGSTRNPASYVGVVGLKPTYGLLSRHGLIPLVNSMDVPGILARSVGDAAVVMNVLAGHDVRDSTTVPRPFEPLQLPDEVPSVKGLCIGIPKEYHAPGTSKDVLEAWDLLANAFDNAGAKVKEVTMPHTRLSIVCYHVLSCCEIASNMARYDGIEYGHRSADESSTEQLYALTRHEGFNEVVRGRILAGNYFLLQQNYESYFLQAQKIRRLISNDFWDVFQGGVDLLLTPTVLSDAPVYDSFSKADNRTRTQEQDVFTQAVNMAGVPAITVPAVLSSKHLPVGLQLIGQPFKDQQMLEVAMWMEQHCCFPRLDLSLLLNNQ